MEKSQGSPATTDSEGTPIVTMEVAAASPAPKVLKEVSSVDIVAVFEEFCSEMLLNEVETTSEGLCCWFASTSFADVSRLREERIELGMMMQDIWGKKSPNENDTLIRTRLQDFIRVDLLKQPLGTPDWPAVNGKFESMVQEIMTYNHACGQNHMMLLAILMKCFVVCNKRTNMVTLLTGNRKSLPENRSATFPFRDHSELDDHLITLTEPVHFVSYNGKDAGGSYYHYNKLEMTWPIREAVLDQFPLYGERMALCYFTLEHIGWIEELEDAVSDDLLSKLKSVPVASPRSPFEVCQNSKTVAL